MGSKLDLLYNPCPDAQSNLPHGPSMNKLDVVLQRLERIEARLARLEAQTGIEIDAPAERPDAPAERPVERLTDSPAPPEPSQSPRAEPPQLPAASRLLAWGAGITFVLAAIYFVRLVYDAGWLTPTRQIGIALLAGIAAIALGLRLTPAGHSRIEDSRRRYAAFLPAVGVVVLYIATYAAHAYYQLVTVGAVLLGVIAITATAIWLHAKYSQTVYALFAVVGAYAFPLFVQATTRSVRDLALYYLVWSLLFCLFALRERSRLLYLVALYFAVIGFDVVWRASGSAQWGQAAAYQMAQFVIFLGTAVYYSIRYRQPMEGRSAIAHGGALLYFYAVEYSLLSQPLPRLTPVLALLSALLVYGAFALAQRRLADHTLLAGGVLTSAYCSLVTVHVVFFELLPSAYFAWGALLSPGALWLVRPQLTSPRQPDRPIAYPVLGAIAFVMLLGFLQLLGPMGPVEVPLASAALLAYAALLYLGYGLSQRLETSSAAGLNLARGTLYSGHMAFMVAIVQAASSGLVISLAWGLFAIALLVYAIWRGDQTVGQSALVVFAASGLKVLLYDLEGSPSLVRVGTLLILGVSLYVGGWLYQRIVVPR